MTSRTEAEIAAATDDELTDWLCELIRESKARDKYNRAYASALGREIAKRPDIAHLLRGLAV